MTNHRRIDLRWLVVGVLLVAALAGAALLASGSDPGQEHLSAAASTWDDVLAEAEGQTVRFWMWGGDEALNEHIDAVVAPAAEELGVTLERVPIEDTADALARIAAEADAGAEDSSVDLVWVNGTNFAQGREARLWLTDWTSTLPSFSLLDPGDPSLSSDFGVPVDGQELPWSRAAFVLAHDSARLAEPPRSFAELADFVRAHRGRVTYPAPPDFTGSAFVRQAVQALGEDEAFSLLAELEPLLWDGGATHPVDQAELDRLFAAGELDLAMSYNPNFVDTAVAGGTFPKTVQPYLFEGGTLQNVSFVAIPARSRSHAGAMVVADLLASPALQADKLARVGVPSVLDLDRLSGAQVAAFETGQHPYRLDDLGTPLVELSVDEVPRLDRRWLDEVAR